MVCLVCFPSSCQLAAPPHLASILLLESPFLLKMSLQAAQWRIGARRLQNFPVRILTPRRNLIPAPSANSGPLMERRADRELPSVQTERRWLRTLPIFAVVVGAAMLGIFNYQKSSSSVVNSTLYALRTSPRAREILGDEIYFAQQMPWISGEMNQLHGRIDISFWVKGTKAQGKMRFRSIRPDRMSFVRLPSSLSAFFALQWHKTIQTSLLTNILVLLVPYRGVEFAIGRWDTSTTIGGRRRPIQQN